MNTDGALTPTYATGPAVNPVTTAQYGLASWTLWVRYRDRARRADALETADWFVEHQRRRAGTWTYGFDYVAPGAGPLPAPWSSALAQGQAISLLRRAYAATGKRRYLLAARRGLRPFRRGVAAGGLVRRWHGRPFYEEYPTRRAPTFVLNGFQQALLGLYDLSDVSPLARRLFRRGMRTLPLVLPEYDLGQSASAYSLAHLHWGGEPTPAKPSYHLAHVGLLRLLNRISPDPVLRRYAHRWSRRLAFG